MTVSYLTSTSTRQTYAAKAVFEAQVSVPALAPKDLPAFIANAEQLFLMDQRVKLQIGGEPVDFRAMLDQSNDREGAAILEGIARRLPRAFSDYQDTQIAEFANYEVAALISSPAFWDTAESALRQTLNRDSVAGDIQLERASQLGMNITATKDGKSLVCHLTANWKEFTEGGRWHTMSDLSPVLKANVKVLIPLKRAGEDHRLEASLVYLHTSSPHSEITKKLKERKTTLGQAILNALANIPLLGRLFRGTQIKVQVGEDFRGHGIAHMPTDLSDLPLVGTHHKRHKTDERAACTHIVAKKLTHRPNWTRQLHASPSYRQPDELPHDIAAPLKALLDHRSNALRRKIGIDVPAIDNNGTQHRLEVQAWQRTVATEQHARQQAETDRDTLRVQIADLAQQVAAMTQDHTQERDRMARLEEQLAEANRRVETLDQEKARLQAAKEEVDMQLNAYKTKVKADISNIFDNSNTFPTVEMPSGGRQRANTFAAGDRMLPTSTTTTSPVNA